MKKDRSCFICCTPYKIYIALSIVLTEKITGDIYIIDIFKGAREMADRIRSTHIFDNVYIVDNPYNETSIERRRKIKGVLRKTKLLTPFQQVKKRLFKRARNLISYIKLKESTNNTYIDFSRNYSRLYFSLSYIPKQVFLHFLKFHKDMKFYFYEDGIGTYSNHGIFAKYDQLSNLFVRFNYTIKVFDPQLFNDMMSSYHIANRVERINQLVRSKSNDECIGTIFGSCVNCSINQSYLILDTIKSEVLDESGVEINKRIYDDIFKRMGINDVIIKYHPRDKKADLSVPYISSFDIPFEVFCYWNEFTNKTIINIFTTAAFTPKILFGQEPKIVFLYKLLEDSLTVQGFDTKILESLKKRYNCKDKVFIPENVEEYENWLKCNEKKHR